MDIREEYVLKLSWALYIKMVILSVAIQRCSMCVKMWIARCDRRRDGGGRRIRKGRSVLVVLATATCRA